MASVSGACCSALGLEGPGVALPPAFELDLPLPLPDILGSAPTLLSSSSLDSLELELLLLEEEQLEELDSDEELRWEEVCGWDGREGVTPEVS